MTTCELCGTPVRITGRTTLRYEPVDTAAELARLAAIERAARLAVADLLRYRGMESYQLAGILHRAVDRIEASLAAPVAPATPPHFDPISDETMTARVTLTHVPRRSPIPFDDPYETPARVCKKCNGKGKKTFNSAAGWYERTCPDCLGTGKQEA